MNVLGGPITAKLKPMNLSKDFRAFSLRGGLAAEPIDPFLGVDHAWISAPTFPAHPHAGFSAVSYLFVDSETGIDNRDSLGNHNVIDPGGLHWTTAARGVIHEEFPVENGKTVHMLQIFVNLATAKQNDKPSSLSLKSEDVPLVELPGVTIRVPLGNYFETHSPLVPPTAVSLLDISLEEGAELVLPIAPGQIAFVMPIEGVLTVNGQDYQHNTFTLPAFTTQTVQHTITLTAPQGRAKGVVFTGTPLNQPVYWKGPMALASPHALEGAIAAYQKGEFGTLHSPIP
ncbi:pirin family protein [Pseudomonas sp. NPDC078700]|uniref:pirin family protein n=1 Tax=Pseudomonas sp. NPDC078700 TaxID=3364424 RepID=UPI0037C68389